MKTSKLLAAAALSMLAAVGVQAETYEGVHALTHEQDRSAVQAEAVVAAHTANPYSDGAWAGVAPALSSSLARSTVRNEAYATAHAPNQNLDGKAFVNSTVPAQYRNGSLARHTRQAAL